MNLYSKIRWRIYWYLINPIYFKFKKNFINLNGEITIGMVTYIVRFNVFKKAFKHLYNNFNDQNFLIVINGYYDLEKQREYLKKIKNFLSKYKNVKIIEYENARSLSHLWNQIIINSDTEKLFIFNDDLDFSPNFRNYIVKSGILNEDIAIINSSWSHFLISKKIIEQVGWFDERLFGVGGEDWDYEARLVFKNIKLKDFNMKGILNNSIKTKDFSYGKNIEIVAEKYTKKSSEFLFKKWEITDSTDPNGKFVRIWGKYIKPIPEMNTPDFYKTTMKGGKS